MKPVLRSSISQQGQRGAVLIVAMVFLLLITIVAVVGSRRSTLELQMATNEQLRAEALEYANAVLDEMRKDDATSSYKPPATPEVNCNVGNADPDCKAHTLSVNMNYLKSMIGAGYVTVDYDFRNRGLAPATVFVQSEANASDVGGDNEKRGFYQNSLGVTVTGQNNKVSSSRVEYGFLEYCNNCAGAAGSELQSKGLINASGTNSKDI